MVSKRQGDKKRKGIRLYCYKCKRFHNFVPAGKNDVEVTVDGKISKYQSFIGSCGWSESIDHW